MIWKNPHKIKIYEALGLIGDKRIVLTESGAKVYSSSMQKHYQILFDEKSWSVMCNDNASYYQGTLGYPVIAYLLLIGKVPLQNDYTLALSGIPWKDVNQKNGNNYEKTISYVNSVLERKGVDMREFDDYCDSILTFLKDHPLGILGEKIRPPDGY